MLRYQQCFLLMMWKVRLLRRRYLNLLCLLRQSHHLQRVLLTVIHQIRFLLGQDLCLLLAWHIQVPHLGLIFLWKIGLLVHRLFLRLGGLHRFLGMRRYAT